MNGRGALPAHTKPTTSITSNYLFILLANLFFCVLCPLFFLQSRIIPSLSNPVSFFMSLAAAAKWLILKSFDRCFAFLVARSIVTLGFYGGEVSKRVIYVLMFVLWQDIMNQYTTVLHRTFIEDLFTVGSKVKTTWFQLA